MKHNQNDQSTIKNEPTDFIFKEDRLCNTVAPYASYYPKDLAIKAKPYVEDGQTVYYLTTPEGLLGLAIVTWEDNSDF